MSPVIDIVLIVLVAVSAFFDVRERRIPNWLTLPGILLGVLLSSVMGLAQLWHSFLGLGAGIGLMIVPFALGWLGAGDVKLFGLVGAFLGIQRLPRVFFYSVLLSGLLALISIVSQGFNLRGFSRIWIDLKLAILSLGQVMPDSIAQRSIDKKKSVPWGVAIGFGAVAALYLDSNGKWAGF